MDVYLFGIIGVAIAVPAGAVIAYRPGLAIGLPFVFFALDQLVLVMFPGVSAYTWIPNVALGAVIAFSYVHRKVWVWHSAADGAPRPVRFAVLASIIFYFLTGVVAGNIDVNSAFLIRAGYLVLFVVVAPALFTQATDLAWGFWVATIGCAVSSIVILNETSSYAKDLGRIAFASEYDIMNPLVIGEVGALTLLLAALVPVWRRWQRAALLLMAIPGVYLASAASRGEIIAAISATAFTGMLFIKSRNFNSKVLWVAATVVLAMSLGGVLYYLQTTTRLGTRWGGAAIEGSIERRVDHIKESTTAYANSNPVEWIVGNGGDYGVAHLESYPHNHLVQSLCETGVIGLALWVFIVWQTFAYVWQTRIWVDRSGHRAFPAAPLLCGVFIFHFALSFKRGTIPDAGMLYAAVLIERYVAFHRAESRKLVPIMPAASTVDHATGVGDDVSVSRG